MEQRKRDRGPLVLSALIALGLLALAAPAAQANWKVGGAELAANEAVEAKTHREFNLLVPAQNLQILCASLVPTSATLFAKSGSGEGKVKFTSCKTWQSSKESAGCKPIEPIVAGGKVNLILAGSIILPLTYFLFEPSKGVPFTTIEFNPAKCALAEENAVTGKLIAECLNSSLSSEKKLCEKEEVTHLLQQSPELVEALFSEDTLKFGESLTYLDGVASVTMHGANLGKIWSAII